jgi:uncharacterized protein YecE (DUF72 family)
MARIYVGTSGYSYADWLGLFYPEGTNKTKFLDYYAAIFNTVEINYTYYTMPAVQTLRAMAAKVGPDFRFSVKAHKSTTHERDADEAVFAAFVRAIRPFSTEGKLAAILAQFPFSFKPSEESSDWLRLFRDRLPDLPVVVEFRNSAWMAEPTFALLEELGFGFCCVDEPRQKGLMPPVARATSSVAYVRFHGRNEEKWYHHEQAWERYDYLYTREELSPWVPKVAQLAGKAEVVYAYFNNHYSAQAITNAALFREMLTDASLIPEPDA